MEKAVKYSKGREKGLWGFSSKCVKKKKNLLVHVEMRQEVVDEK